MNALNSGKNDPPESTRLFWGLKHSEKGRIFSTPSSHKQSSYFAKKKMVSSGLKKALPHTLSHHHQLDDQDKEPMIDTIIRGLKNDIFEV